MRKNKPLILFLFGVLLVPIVGPYFFDLIEFLVVQPLSFWFAVYFLAILTAIAKGVMNSRDQILQEISDSFKAVNENLNGLSKELKEITQAIRQAQPVGLASAVRFFIINKDGQEERMKLMVRKADAAPDKFRVRFADKFGNAAPVDGLPELSLLNNDNGAAKISAFAAVEGEIGVYEGQLDYMGVAGKTQIDLLADGDMGEGKVEVRAQSEVVEILAADASVAIIEFLPPA